MQACIGATDYDLSMEGAIDKFDTRRAAARARQMEDMRGAGESSDTSPEETPASLAKPSSLARPLPPRRELLQVRVPAALNVGDIVDGVVAASIAAANNNNNMVTEQVQSATPQPETQMRTLNNAIKVLEAAIESKKRELRGAQAAYEVEKILLTKLDKRHSKMRVLILQEFKIQHEDLLQKTLQNLDEEYEQTRPETILGLSQNNGLTRLALFGRNQMALPNEYVDLNKSFLFVGGDIGTTGSLGKITGRRMDDLAAQIGSRNLSVNLTGLRLPIALRSIARSIDLPIYLSAGVDAASEHVRLNISRADALDVLDIIIDNYGLAMAYDRKMGIARIYTQEEFKERMDVAVQIAQEHNRRARNLRKISNLENDTQAITQVYQAYFQHPDEAGRARSLTNDALIEDEYSPKVSAAIVKFKQAALENERKFDKLEEEQGAIWQEQASKTQIALFALEDEKTNLAKLLTDREAKIAELTQMRANTQAAQNLAQADEQAGEQKAGALATPKNADNVAETAPQEQGQAQQQAEQSDAWKFSFLSGPNAETLRGRVIADANLLTTKPVYTEKFTIYNSEGSSNCTESNSDRVAEIRMQLKNYFLQLYPDTLIAAERAAEQEAAQEATQIANAPSAKNIDETITPAALTYAADSAPLAALIPPTETDAAPENDMAKNGASPSNNDANNIVPQFGNSAFRRPKITSVADTVIVTGFKHDVELAASLIDNLDRPDKQVLVEVFMVNVVKNWQRQLQSRLLNASRVVSQADPDLLAVPDDIRNQLPDLVSVKKDGLLALSGALNFASRAAAGNSFSVNNFRLGLSWTIDFMERNALGRKISSPTILALDGCPAVILKRETLYLPVTQQSAPVVNEGIITPGQISTEYQQRKAELKLEVTPTINALNNHVRLTVDFNDDFFVTSDPNSDQISSQINTQFIAAPGDVIVLAGLYTEDNFKERNGLPGTTKVPFLSQLLGSSSDALSTQEMVIFLAPEVITPSAGTKPVNSAEYYGY
ncbi:MAG: hypothetical protein ACR2OT_06995 [Parvibaculales bacterium]